MNTKSNERELQQEKPDYIQGKNSSPGEGLSPASCIQAVWDIFLCGDFQNLSGQIPEQPDVTSKLAVLWAGGWSG